LTTETAKPGFRIEATLSVVMHIVLLGACVWYFRNPLTNYIVAAGDGEGGGENVIEVGTVDGRMLGFTPFRALSTVGDEPDKANNTDVSTETPPPDPDADVLPSTNPTPNPKDSLKTNRPTIQSPQFVSPDPLRGGTLNTNVEIGRTGGSPIPSMVAGVGMVSGTGGSGTSGVPGGSAYARIVLGILGRNYNPTTAIDAGGIQYVIVELRIARDGRILSVVNGRVAPNYIKRRSPIDLLNNAVERAVIASNPLPPFPNGFLMGSQEGVMTIKFQYPK
jgi:outer membrane biosynthesis protein TonB